MTKYRTWHVRLPLVVAVGVACLVALSTLPAGAASPGGNAPGSAPVHGHLAGTDMGGSHTANWLAAADGGVFTYGDAGYFGSAGALQLDAPIVGIAAMPDTLGYWLAAADGGVFTYGDAGFFGSAGALHLNAPIVGMAATSDGGGYWLVAADGGVFTYGNAGFFGSAGGTPLDAPIVGMAATSDGQGYWLVASDGGVLTYGDAGFFGSAGGTPAGAPIVGMAATPDGQGYWLVTKEGEILAYGDAGTFGSAAGTLLGAPIVAVTATADGGGYWLVAADGTILSYGDAASFGSSAGPLQLAAPVVGMAAEGMVIPSTTTVLDPTYVDSISGSPGSSQTVVLSAGTIPPPVGQVLDLGASPQAPEGFLGTVSSVTTNPDGTVSVVTQPATLDDLFSAGTFAISATLDATDVASPSASGSQVLTPADVSPHRVLQPLVVPMPKEDSDIDCEGDVELSAGGSISLTPTWNFSDSHDLLSLDPSASVTISVTGAEEAEVDATVSASASCDYSDTLGTIEFKEIEGDIFGIPFTVQPELTLKVEGSVDVDASITAQIVQTMSITVGGTVGVQCSPSLLGISLLRSHDILGTGLNCNSTSSPIYSYTPSTVTPSVEADGEATASVSLTGELGFEIDDFLTPYISVGPELSATADADASNVDGPSASWSIEACLNAGAGVDIEVPDIDYELDFSNDDIFSWCKDLGGSGGGTDDRPTAPSPS